MRLSLLVVAVLWLSSVNLIAEESDFADFKENAPEAWKAVDAEYSGNRFKIESRTDERIDGVLFRQTFRSLEVSLLLDRIRIEGEIRVPKGKLQEVEKLDRFALVFNEDYAANVDLNGGNPALSAAYLSSLDHYTKRKLKSKIDSFPAFRLQDEYLPECLIDMPGFHNDSSRGRKAYRVLDVEKILKGSNSGKYLLQIVAVATDENGEFTVQADPKVYSGELLLDPSRHWCVLECREKYINSEGVVTLDYECTNEFADSTSAGSFHPSSHRSSAAFTGGEDLKTAKREFSPLETSRLLADDFTLTGFGLPEPALGSFWPRVRLFLYVVAGLMCLWFLVLRARRTVV